MYTLPERSIEDFLDYGVDWSQWLAVGETIASVVVDAGRQGDSVISSAAEDNTNVTFWLASGSVTPALHYIDVKITTSASRVRKVTLQIPVTV